MNDRNCLNGLTITLSHFCRFSKNRREFPVLLFMPFFSEINIKKFQRGVRFDQNTSNVRHSPFPLLDFCVWQNSPSTSSCEITHEYWRKVISISSVKNDCKTHQSSRGAPITVTSLAPQLYGGLLGICATKANMDKLFRPTLSNCTSKWLAGKRT